MTKRASLLCSLLVAVAFALGRLAVAQPSEVSFSTSESTWMSLDVSRDGQTLIFELLGDIYTLPTRGGEARPLLTGQAFQSQPRYAPDGSSIVYISDASGSDNVWIVQSDGSDARQLTDLPNVTMVSPAWSADGTSVFVTVISTAGFNREAEIWQFACSRKGVSN